MVMPTVGMIVMVAIAAIRATLRLEGNLNFREFGSEAVEHFLDHMVWANAKDILSNLRWKVPVSQMPSKAHQLVAILMPDFDYELGGRLNP
jgi:hypothetical protein